MSNPNEIDVTVGDGKYRVLYNQKEQLRALMHGAAWRNLAGDNLVYFLASELQDAREKIKRLESILDKQADYLQLG